MSEQTEMRECPFCGRHNIGTDYGPYRQWVQCFCHDCGASAASCDSEVLAIAAWNQRAGEADYRRLRELEQAVRDVMSYDGVDVWVQDNGGQLHAHDSLEYLAIGRLMEGEG